MYDSIHRINTYTAQHEIAAENPKNSIDNNLNCFFNYVYTEKEKKIKNRNLWRQKMKGGFGIGTKKALKFG